MSQFINFLLLDGARIEDKLDEAKNMNEYHASLYKGKSEEILAAVAPYLFIVPPKKKFIKWVENNIWGNSGCVMLSSDLGFADVYMHLRNFLMVKGPDNKDLYFRFYDPRVLKKFLPTCTKEQLSEFFGPINLFAVEDGNKEDAVVFQQLNAKLQSDNIKANIIFK